MTRLNWAVLGTGNIAARFAKGLKMSRTGVLASVGSRSQAKADDFAAPYSAKGFDSYEAAVANSDAVYIALPHHMHEEWTIRCAELGKAILCEKPFTLNAESAARALAVVNEKKVYFQEAFMYRCHPQTHQLKAMVDSGDFGKLRHISADFGFAASMDWTGFRSENALGGGALMDVGCYCVSMSILLAGQEPVRVEYAPQMTDRRYDGLGAGLMQFLNGMTADFRTAVHYNLPNQVVLFFETAKVVVEQPWFCEGRVLVHRNGQPEPEVIAAKGASDLYALEADAVADSLAQGEYGFMTKDETMRVMRTLDRLRASCGFWFDGEGS